MSFFRTVLITSLALPLLAAAGCVTSDGRTSGGGWVVLGDNNRQAPPTPSREKAGHPGRGEGLDVAARNHVRSAYRFLEKGNPDHAMRELEKARSKMDRDFWYHYYMGGAYYLKGMYPDARDSWETAFRFTNDQRLRSRVRTCQSFVVFRIQGQQPTIGFLRNAADLDRDNHTARGLLDDLFVSGDDPGADSPRPGFLRDAPPEDRPGGREEEGRYSADADGDEDVRRRGGGRKDEPERDKGQKKAREEKDKEGKGAGKKRYQIEESERFRSYFFVEMP